MIQIKIKQYIFFLLFFISFNSYDKTNLSKSETSNEISPSNDVMLLIEIEKLKSENNFLNEKLIINENNQIKDNFDVNQKVKELKDDIIEIMNIYLFFIGVILALIGAAINFFGKKAIKKRVEEIIQDTAQTYAQTKTDQVITEKITEEYIAKIIKDKGEIEINRLLNDLENKGHQTIQGIKQKGDQVINSVWAAPPQHNKKYFEKQSTDEEIKESKEIIRAEEFFNLAFNTKDPKIRIALYENVLELEPENFAALNNLGVAYNDLYKFVKAIEYLDKAIEIAPNYGLAYANRANSYNQLDHFDNALVDADKSIQLNPNLEWPYSIIGNVLTKQKKFVEAEEILTKAISINPQSAVAYFNRGYFNEEVKKYNDSINDYLKAEKLGHNNLPLLYNNLAVGYRRKGEFDKAIEYLNKAREINPDWPNIDGTMALICSDKGDSENFYNFLKRALDKGCPVWNYLDDYAFDPYRNKERLKKLIEPYQKHNSL
jgi:tetratricopeptide (TPR) repeat protein